MVTTAGWRASAPSLAPPSAGSAAASPPPLVAGDHNVIIVVTGPDQLKQLRDPVEPALRKKG
jgi:hypothetical protein